jgi:anti-repressor protein
MALPNGLNIISESGLCTLIMRSNKPEAKRFRKWMTAEVLPGIRKTGAYAAPAKLDELLSDPDSWIRTLTDMWHNITKQRWER